MMYRVISLLAVLFIELAAVAEQPRPKSRSNLDGNRIGMKCNRNVRGLIFDNIFEVVYPHIFVKDSVAMVNGCETGPIKSTDSNFECYISMLNISTVKDSIFMDCLRSLNKMDRGSHVRNHSHINRYCADFAYSSGTFAPDWSQFDPHYYTRKESLQMFNADTVVTYPMNIARARRDIAQRFTSAGAIIAHRNGVGDLLIYYFATVEGERKIKKYVAALGKMFRFDNKILEIR